MASSLAKTKRRIASIKGTQKITKAMELTSTVKSKRLQNLHEQGKGYADEFSFLMAAIAKKAKGEIPYLSTEEDKGLPTLYILLSSDMGLCGAYNNNVIKYAKSLLKPNDFLAPIGSKAVSHFKNSKDFKNIIFDYSSLNALAKGEGLIELADKIKDDFDSGKYGSVKIIYTRYKNSITFVPTVRDVLPFSLQEGSWENESFAPPLIEGDPLEMLNSLIKPYLVAIIHDAYIEAELSEQSSRRTAMDNANDNADELLNKLTIEYNKARQNAITQEITEVVGGASV